ncbi:DNA-directed RNA polymerase subunit omega [Hyphobacterium sp. CCMP332]|nr:DNA-directed RNA polymerase subunit omega [Hyphobacterium sp. CCMP332]
MANNASIVTRDVVDLCDETKNVYESIIILTKRARQIAVKEKEELSSKLAEFATTVDNLEEIFENKEQIEISKHYEKMPKPSAKSIEEFHEDKIVFRQPSKEDGQDDLLI